MPSTPLNCLVIDDRSDIRRRLCCILKALGHTSSEAANVEEALSLIADNHYNFFVIGSLPDPRNSEWMVTFVRLLESGKRIPILLLTKSVLTEAFKRTMAEADSYLELVPTEKQLGVMIWIVLFRAASFKKPEVVKVN